MVQLTVTGQYTAKDQGKASRANKFIGRGSVRSSTNSYAKDFGVLANCGNYNKDDVVFISAEGNRGGRLSPDFKEIEKSVVARATLITDVLIDRNRPYNTGEREVASYISSRNYYESVDGTWVPDSL